MPIMTGLAIIVTAADPARFRAALTLAIAQHALGGRVRVYCHEASVALLATTYRDDEDRPALAAAGLPDRRALIAMAQESGVTLIACQTGLAIAGLSIEALVPGVESGGMMGLLADLGDDRLVTV
jgi:predicted peroxiredoxin